MYDQAERREAWRKHEQQKPVCKVDEGVPSSGPPPQAPRPAQPALAPMTSRSPPQCDPLPGQEEPKQRDAVGEWPNEAVGSREKR